MRLAAPARALLAAPDRIDPAFIRARRPGSFSARSSRTHRAPARRRYGRREPARIELGSGNPQRSASVALPLDGAAAGGWSAGHENHLPAALIRQPGQPGDRSGLEFLQALQKSSTPRAPSRPLSPAGSTAGRRDWNRLTLPFPRPRPVSASSGGEAPTCGRATAEHRARETIPAPRVQRACAGRQSFRRDSTRCACSGSLPADAASARG